MVLRFVATLTIDAKPSAKKFQGVWLSPTSVKSGGVDRYVIAYRPRPWWRLFEGQQVEVVGMRYQPFGQAIGAEHLRVHSLTVVDPVHAPTPRFIWIGPESSYSGVFGSESGQPGSKSAGETWPVFRSDDGTSYTLVSSPPAADQLGKQVTIKARPLRPSPYATHRGGPRLWVIEIEPASD